MNEEVVKVLRSVVENTKCVVSISTTEDTDKIIKKKALTRSLNYICIDGSMDDPIFQFWRIFKAEALAHDCHVLFLDIKRDTGWVELERAFAGSKFGTLFLMRVSENSRPSISPSQRGLYMK